MKKFLALLLALAMTLALGRLRREEGRHQDGRRR